MQSYIIKKFELSSMTTSPLILIIGKRESGKSFLIKNIMHHLFTSVSGGMVVDPKMDRSNFYQSFFPNLFVHKDFSNEKLTEITKNSEDFYKTKTKNILVLDDCFSDANKPTLTRDLALMHNSAIITCIMSFQDLPRFYPETSVNFDYVFLFGSETEHTKKSYWNKFASFIEYSVFNRIFDGCTTYNRVMVINQRANSNNVEDIIFWYKATDNSFLFGSTDFRDLHNLLYNEKCNHAYAATDMMYGSCNLLPNNIFNVFVNMDKVDPSKIKPQSESFSKAPETIESYNFNDLIEENSSKNYLDKDICINTISDIDKEPKEPKKSLTKNETFQLSYQDDNYSLNVNLTDLTNSSMVKILCDHIIQIKKTK